MKYSVLPWVTAISLSMVSMTAYAALPVNTTNNGQIIQGGTYTNTANNVTTFINSKGTGLWLKSGSNVRGIEVDGSGNVTNNGGTLFLDAPNQVVRLDGNIDVRGIQNNTGSYLGNGGKVFVDAAYLFQKGNIYADGLNGGMVEFNVGALTMGNSARIQATGSGGNGGTVAVNASSSVDLGQDTVINTSGKVAGTFDSNVINIEGSLVNAQGNLIADGIQSRGGTIRLVSTGQTDLEQANEAIQSATTNGIFSTSEQTAIQTQLNNLKTQSDGNIKIGPITNDSSGMHGILEANGASGQFDPSSLNNDPADTTARSSGDGGTIILTAQNTVNNEGWVTTNGGNTTTGKAGNGGTISMNAGSDIANTGRIVSNGGNGQAGGDGGLIAFSYTDMSNTGVIRATGGQGGSSGLGIGGNGGLTVFSSLNNPTGNGTVMNMGGLGSTPGQIGNIVIPDAATATNNLIGIWRKTQPIEMLINAENLIVLNNNNPLNNKGDLLSDDVSSAQLRSLQDQAGEGPDVTSGIAQQQLTNKLLPLNSKNTTGYFLRNFIFSQLNTNSISLNIQQLTRQAGLQNEDFPFNTFTLLSNGNIDGRFTGVRNNLPSFGNSLGYFSSISPSFEGGVSLKGESGINIATTLFTDISQISATSPFTGGSLIIKSLSDIFNNAGIGMGGDINQGSFFGENILGGNIQLIAKDLLWNVSAMSASGSIRGGNMYLAGHQNFINDGNPVGDPTEEQPFNAIHADGGSYGGNILVNSPNIDEGDIEALGSTFAQNGKVSTESLP